MNVATRTKTNAKTKDLVLSFELLTKYLCLVTSVKVLSVCKQAFSFTVKQITFSHCDQVM